MINRADNPLGWSMMLYDLTDAHEHLGNLIKEAADDPEFSEPDLRLQLGHVYAHLNRAWRRREVAEDFAEGEWEGAGAFPDDLEPVA